MFDEEFYPTPAPIIRKLLDGLTGKELAKMVILEPSAGRGDIADAIEKRIEDDGYGYNRRSNKKVLCIEKQPDLRMILTSKKYRVVAEDFLAYQRNQLVDLIVMNPPFSEGASHLLKAWEVLNGGEVRCLLNTETLNNPFSKERKLLAAVIQDHGSVEHLGACFVDAERTTKVEVSLVRLVKTAPDVEFSFFDDIKASKTDIPNLEDATPETMPAVVDQLGNLEIEYRLAVEALAESKRAIAKFQALASRISDGINAEELTGSFNDVVDLLQERAWNRVFNQTGAAKFMTKRVKDEFDEYRKQIGGMDFSKDNIESFVRTIFDNRKTILIQSVEDAFELMTKYDKKNKVHVEGWKTNDAWKVNRKVIVPWGCNRKEYESDLPRIHYSYSQELSDIEKALSFLNGDQTPENRSSIEMTLLDAGREAKYGVLYESKYFRFRCYQKGTLHLEFIDKHLWENFNIFVAKSRNWLPDDYKSRK